jgi:ABC-type thiamin/hydroxymethylpyrimidine transport system permease subunit
MHKTKDTPTRGLAKIATVDLVLMSLFASMGIATKNVLRPLIGTVTGALDVPTGAVAGGFYMMWIVMAYGLVRKRGAASTTSLIQALMSLVMPYGNFGLLSFVIYLGPGLAVDGLFLVSRHKACCAPCCIVASAAANAVGTILVGALVLMLPPVVLAFLAIVAAISGGVGGYIANMLLVRVKKIGLGGKLNIDGK